MGGCEGRRRFANRHLLNSFKHLDTQHSYATTAATCKTFELLNVVSSRRLFCTVKPARGLLQLSCVQSQLKNFCWFDCIKRTVRLIAWLNDRHSSRFNRIHLIQPIHLWPCWQFNGLAAQVGQTATGQLDRSVSLVCWHSLEDASSPCKVSKEKRSSGLRLFNERVRLVNLGLPELSFGDTRRLAQ